MITDRAMKQLLAFCIVLITREADLRTLQPESMDDRHGAAGLSEKIHGRRAECEALESVFPSRADEYQSNVVFVCIVRNCNGRLSGCELNGLGIDDLVLACHFQRVRSISSGVWPPAAAVLSVWKIRTDRIVSWTFRPLAI